MHFYTFLFSQTAKNGGRNVFYLYKSTDLDNQMNFFLMDENDRPGDLTKHEIPVLAKV